jgi:hypothetical protein
MSILDEMSTKYVWWKAGDDPALTARRVLAQVMDIADYDDVQRVLEVVGETPLRDVLANAEPGWFKPRSWHYWHYRLGVVEPGEPVPALPRRTFR